MAINEKSYAYGASKSSIREIFAYGMARKAEVGPENVYDFSLGNPSIPAPDEVRASLARSLELPAVQLHGYTPANGAPAAREAVAASLTRRFQAECGDAPVAGPEDLYLTCGAAASLSITFHALVNPGDEIIVIAPYFPEYRVWIETSGATCVEVLADQKTFQIDIEGVRAAINANTKAVVINSPNNPVGAVYTRANLEALAAVLREKEEELGTSIYLITDEPYREITYGAEVAWVPPLYDRTIVCYSYSKSLSLPGERIGWVLVPPTNPDHDDLVLAVAGAGRKLGFVCAPAIFQRVLIDCVDVPSDVEAYARNRKALTEGLARLGYEYIEPDGAFYLWVKALEPDAEAFFQKAKALDLLPVPSDSFGCPGWVRIGYCVSYETIVNSRTFRTEASVQLKLDRSLRPECPGNLLLGLSLCPSARIKAWQQVLSVEVVEDGDGGNREEHADGAKHAAAHDDADQDEEARHAERGAEEPRLDDVTVKNLQHRGEGKEDDGEAQVDEQKDERANGGTDEGAEGGGKVGDGHHKGDQADVGYAYHGHEQGVQAADYETVKQVEDDVAVENRVAATQKGDGRVVLLGRKQRGEQVHALVLETHLLGEEVDGEQQGD